MVAALGASALPALAAPGDGSAPAAVSAWGRKADRQSIPPVKVGATKPPASRAASAPSAAEAAWQAEQRKRAEQGDEAASPAARSSADVRSWVPRGQGAVPWHQISDIRVTDSLVARVNLSNGNLMLAATDFEVAGVGQKLRLAR
ncbi:RHS repeat protein, partial [Streptomyces californicus]|nr:RHS repeat protein [Streptomyces californicus]